MVDLHSPRVSLTVSLPDGLVQELERLAREKQISVDDVVMEACLAYTEPYGWERHYKEHLRTHPTEIGINGNDRNPPESRAEAKPA